MHSRNLYSILLLLLAVAVAATAQQKSDLDVKLPLQRGSVRFAIIGDSGTGDHDEYEIANELAAYQKVVKFDFVLMLGDNIYGSHRDKDFQGKFAEPFKPLLDAGVKFYAVLGNHDDPDIEKLYKPFNMGGERYYTFKKGDVEFFALDSNYMDPTQLSWVSDKLKNSNAKWKIAFFHHPLYSDGKSHGPDLDLRSRLAPLFRAYGVNAVFNGHEHVYERLKPQDGIAYFILGNSAKLMRHDFRQSDQMVKSFDTDRGFMLVEVAGDQMYFQTIARGPLTIDAGVVARSNAPGATASK